MRLNTADPQREKAKTSRSNNGKSQKLNRPKVWANPKDLSLGAFLKKKKLAKGVCKGAKLATLCISRPWVKQKVSREVSVYIDAPPAYQW